MSRRIILPLGMVLLIIASCSQKKESSEQAQEAKEHESWGYMGNVGPENWAAIQGEYAPCRDGQHQSPVNILSGGINAKHNLDFDYHASQEVILNNGHTVELLFEGGSFINFDEDIYQLLQFHFHTPSEHLVDEQHFPLEMHLVHRSMDTTYLVIGMMFEKGEANEFLDKFIKDAPKTVQEKSLQKQIDVMDLHPDTTGYYYYMGSFTTPPCTEGVRWLVKKNPLTASEDQIALIAGIEGENFRPDQELNGRQVEEF